MTEAHRWPAVPVAEWLDTRDTLHLDSKVIGRVGSLTSS